MKKLNLFLLFFICTLICSFSFAQNAKAAIVDLEPVSISFYADPDYFPTDRGDKRTGKPCVKNEYCVIKIGVKNSGSDDLTSSSGLGPNSYRLNTTNFNKTGDVLPTISEDSPFTKDKTIYIYIKGFFTEEGVSPFGIEINSTDQLMESISTNNYISESFNIGSQYDIKANSIEVNPKYPKVNQDVVITVKMENNGFARLKSSTGLTNYQLNIDGFTQTDKDLQVVNNDNMVYYGEEIVYYFYGKFISIGEKNMKFEADATDKIKEENEDNNTVSGKVTVYDTYDQGIKIKSLTASKNNPLVDELITIKINAENNGKVSLTDGTGILAQDDLTVMPLIKKDIDYNLADFEVTDFTYSDLPSAGNPLDPGEGYAYNFKGYFPKVGEKEISFEINANNRLFEKIYNDNIATTSLTVYKDAAERDDFEIESYGVNYYSSKSAEIWWNTTRKTTGSIEYRKEYFTSNTGANSTASTQTHKIKIKNLDSSQKYIYSITSSYGSVTKYVKNESFYTPDNNEILITASPNVDISDTMTSISWSTNLLTTTKVYYRNIATEDDYKTAKTDGYTCDHLVSLNNLPVGSYEYYVVSENELSDIYVSIKYNFVINPAVEDEEPTQEEIEAELENETPTLEAEDENIENEIENTNDNEAENEKEITNSSLYNQLKGKIVLTVESRGEAYYIDPVSQKRYYLGRPADAFSVMRQQGIGITNADLNKISIGMSSLSGPDTDGDTLSDIFEDAVGTDKNTKDSDSDGHDDNIEIETGYNPNGSGVFSTNESFAKKQAGKILLQVENNGEAWYISPQDNKRYFLGRPADAFSVMRELGLGISNTDFDSL